MDNANPLRARNPSISLRNFAVLQFAGCFQINGQQIYAKRLSEVERWHFLDDFSAMVLCCIIWASTALPASRPTSCG